MSSTMLEAAASLDREAISRQFDQDGYVVLPNAISQEKLQAIRTIIADRINSGSSDVFDPPSELLRKVYSQQPAKGIISDLFVNCPETLDVVCNPRMVEMLNVILGENFVMLPDSVAAWGYYNILHTDTTTAEQQGWMYHKEPDYRIVVVGYYLQESVNGGGLYIVPGTHKEQDPFVELRKSLTGKQEKLKKSKFKQALKFLSGGRLYNYEQPFLTHPRGFAIPSRAGDAIIFDMRLLHRSSFPKPGGPTPDGGKMSIFVHASRNNAHAHNYLEYISTKGTCKHLHGPRDTAEQERRCSEAGFTAL